MRDIHDKTLLRSIQIFPEATTEEYWLEQIYSNSNFNELIRPNTIEHLLHIHRYEGWDDNTTNVLFLNKKNQFVIVGFGYTDKGDWENVTVQDTLSPNEFSGAIADCGLFDYLIFPDELSKCFRWRENDLELNNPNHIESFQVSQERLQNIFGTDYMYCYSGNWAEHIIKSPILTENNIQLPNNRRLNLMCSVIYNKEITDYYYKIIS